MNSLEAIINDLKSSPLFYLFVSSRELFHSNFWFWLSTLNQIETTKLFSLKENNQSFVFKREHNQHFNDFKSSVDLLISVDNLPRIVIENKVKDFPTDEQLQRIKNSFKENDIDFVLTTLFWTNDLSFEGWRVITYKQISNAIIPERFTENSYYKSLILDYKSFTINLARLTENLEINQKYDFAISLNKGLYNKLNDIKLWEGYQKLRASHLLYHFKKINSRNIFTGYSINNQKVTIDFTLGLKDGYRIGIQIEDIQYRKFVFGRKAGKFTENLIGENVFFNDRFIGRGKKTYLNYGDVFKYQYEKIGSLTFKDLFDRVNNDLAEIMNNLDKIEKQIPSS